MKKDAKQKSSGAASPSAAKCGAPGRKPKAGASATAAAASDITATSAAAAASCIILPSVVLTKTTTASLTLLSSASSSAAAFDAIDAVASNSSSSKNYNAESACKAVTALSGLSNSNATTQSSTTTTIKTTTAAKTTTSAAAPASQVVKKKLAAKIGATKSAKEGRGGEVVSMKEENAFDGNSEEKDIESKGKEKSSDDAEADDVLDLVANTPLTSALSSKKTTLQPSASSTTTKEVPLKVNEKSTADLRLQIGSILKEGGKKIKTISNPQDDFQLPKEEENKERLLIVRDSDGEEEKRKEEKYAEAMEFEEHGGPGRTPTPALKSGSGEESKKLGEHEIHKNNPSLSILATYNLWFTPSSFSGNSKTVKSKSNSPGFGSARGKSLSPGPESGRGKKSLSGCNSRSTSPASSDGFMGE